MNICDIISTIAVVLSVTFLAIQIRRSFLESIVSSFREVTKVLATDEQLGLIFAVGIQSWESLNTKDRIRFAHMAFQFMKVGETLWSYKLIAAGKITGGWKQLMACYMSAPGMQTYWRLRKQSFNRKFNKWVESLQKSSDESMADNWFKLHKKNGMFGKHGYAVLSIVKYGDYNGVDINNFIQDFVKPATEQKGVKMSGEKKSQEIEYH